jgi:hypothetical protein
VSRKTENVKELSPLMQEHRGDFKKKSKKKRDMFIFDPIASLIVVAGVFIYFACKGSVKSKTNSYGQTLRSKDEIKKDEKTSSLSIEQIVENYRIRKERIDAEREDKRRYEWWLFKHSDEYEKEMERIERCLKN